jgi:hypothetical protein
MNEVDVGERGGLAWDRRLGGRAAGIAVVVVAVTLIIVAATDEGGPWPQRLGMTAALAPVAGALGALASARIASARGELRALAAVGAGPVRATLGAVMGGAAVGLAGPLVAALGLADLASLFPRSPAARAWILAEDGGLRETTLGITVDAAGALGLGARAAASLPAVPGGAARLAMLVLVLSAIVGPAWLVTGEGGSPARRAVVGAAAIAAAIAAFQMVAAGRASPWALVAAPIVLLVDAAAGYPLRARGTGGPQGRKDARTQRF